MWGSKSPQRGDSVTPPSTRVQSVRQSARISRRGRRADDSRGGPRRRRTALHSFTTEAYLRERTLPALRSARGSLDGFTLCLPVFAAIADDEKTMSAAQSAVRAQIAFYGSTPAYRPVLDLHGWGELHERLNTLSRRQEWTEMGKLITDEVLNAFAVSCTAAQVAAAVLHRFGDVIDRISLYAPRPPDHAALMTVKDGLRAATR